MRTRHHFGLNVQVQLLLMTIFFFLLPNAAPYLSLIFDSLLDLDEFRGKSTYIQHPGTAEPFRIAPAEPVAYTNLSYTAYFSNKQLQHSSANFPHALYQLQTLLGHS
jgi:hypothetical protein